MCKAIWYTLSVGIHTAQKKRTGAAYNRCVVLRVFGELGLTALPHGFRIKGHLRKHGIQKISLSHGKQRYFLHPVHR